MNHLPNTKQGRSKLLARRCQTCGKRWVDGEFLSKVLECHISQKGWKHNLTISQAMRIRTEHLKLGYVILSMFFSVKKNDSFKTFSGFGESQLTGP